MKQICNVEKYDMVRGIILFSDYYQELLRDDFFDDSDRCFLSFLARNLLNPDLDALDEIGIHYQELSETDAFGYDGSEWLPCYLHSLGYYVDDPEEDEDDTSDETADETKARRTPITRLSRTKDKKLHEKKLRRIARQNGNRNGPREKKRCVVPSSRKLSNTNKWNKRLSNRRLRHNPFSADLGAEEGRYDA